MSHKEATGWQQLARCRNEDPDSMQPERATPDEVEAALAVCSGCPVIEQCRQLAESQPGAYGVHAGEWWGDPPHSPLVKPCAWCGGDMDNDPLGRPREYCSKAHREAARRARAAA